MKRVLVAAMHHESNSFNPSLRERTNSVYSADRNFLRTSAITIP